MTTAVFPAPLQRAIILSMCGRYRLSRRKQFIAEYFDSIPGDDDWEPRGAGDLESSDTRLV